MSKTAERPLLVVDKGATVAFADLPPHSIALDGYVQGPQVDAGLERYSFDHHAGCLRHATLSTCEQVLDALRVGLNPGGSTLYVNDLDADTVLSVWLLRRPAAAQLEAVASAVRAVGRVDALGPAIGGPGMVPALRWALEPMLTAVDLRTGTTEAWQRCVVACEDRLDAWCDAGAPTSSPAMPVSDPPATDMNVLFNGGYWQLVESSVGLSAFGAVYATGVRAAIVLRALADGTNEYTVGKASEFVSIFDVPALLAALAKAELKVNPQQDPMRTWGGGSTIGGSPRNTDGSASRLDWRQVVEVAVRCSRGAGT